MSMLMNSISHTAWESNIQHIRLVMSRVAIDARSEAFRCERNTGLANKRRSIITIGISPHTIHLHTSSVSTSNPEMTDGRTKLTNLFPQTTAMTLSGCNP